MRWEELFGDLEGQFDAAESAELATEVADRTRREISTLRFVDRLRPAIGRPIDVRLRGASTVGGRLAALGPDWFLVAQTGTRETLVATHAVLSIGGLAAQSASPMSEGVVAARLDFPFALRTISRDRSPVAISLVDGSQVSGTIDRVGADFIEVAEHAAGEVRRRAAVQSVRTYPIVAVAAVSRA
jgi:hypothetical protein